jgi:DNA-binding CsgD family transcriptional regulator
MADTAAQRIMAGSSTGGPTGQSVDGGAAGLRDLTPRQRDVVDGIPAGKPNKAIARRLGNSCRTVEAHRAAAMWKRRVSNAAELMRLSASSRRANACVETLVESYPGLVAFWDHKLVCRMANDDYFEWFQKSLQDMQGIHLRDLLQARLWDLNWPYIAAALSGGKQRFKRMLVKPDATLNVLAVDYVPTLNAKGAVSGFFAFATDITPRSEVDDAVRTERVADAILHAVSQLRATRSG